MDLIDLKREHQKLIDCKDDIMNTMSESYDGFRLHMNFDELIVKHGYDRINQVFAATIMEYEDDGRINSHLKEWAKRIEVPIQYVENNRMRLFVIHNHPGLVNIATDKFLRIQREIPTIENKDGYQYQILMKEKDFAILQQAGENPEYAVVSGLRFGKDHKFEWDSVQCFSNWDNAISCYMDGIVDKMNIMIRNATKEPIEEAAEDEDEDEFEL